jgi:hypothetical protein
MLQVGQILIVYMNSTDLLYIYDGLVWVENRFYCQDSTTEWCYWAVVLFYMYSTVHNDVQLSLLIHNSLQDVLHIL